MEIKSVTITPTKPKKGDQVAMKIDTELSTTVVLFLSMSVCIH